MRHARSFLSAAFLALAATGCDRPIPEIESVDIGTDLTPEGARPSVKFGLKAGATSSDKPVGEPYYPNGMPRSEPTIPATPPITAQ